MTDSMKAIVYHGPKDTRLESIAVPPCGDDEIHVKVDACGLRNKPKNTPARKSKNQSDVGRRIIIWT